MSALLTLLAFISLEATAAATFKEERQSKCERISVQLCADMPYNLTRLPNTLGHMTQEKVAEDIAHYDPLIRVSCSPSVKFFICSMFTPMCSEHVDTPIMSCRSVCQQVKRDCIKTLNDFGFSWPDVLNCSRFPQDDLCMQPNADSRAKDSATNDNDKSRWGKTDGTHSSSGSDAKPPEDDGPQCPHDSLVALDPSDPSAACAPLCGRDLLFLKDHKRFAELWMGIWATLCLLVTGFTVATCWLDRVRFKFPERSIIHLAACYHVYSWGYIVRLILGAEEVSCHPLKSGRVYLISGGLDNPKCVVIFIILYYFNLASCIWWVILGLSWTLAARSKWSHEAIESYSSYFHLFAWGLPALLSIVVLITHRVDASELTGLCFVGNTDILALVGFVLAPTAVFLLLGCGFICAGFVGLCSVRKELRTKGSNDVSKLERLMTKIGIFSFLYVIPSVSGLACSVYHIFVLWYWQPDMGRCRDGGENCGLQPQVQVYMLQIFMSLIVGITSGMWVSSQKTYESWRKFLRCCWKAPEKKQEQTPLVAMSSSSHPMQTSSRPTVARVPATSSHSSGGTLRNYVPYYPPHSISHYHPPTRSSDASKV